jgi:hypothetical protein
MKIADELGRSVCTKASKTKELSVFCATRLARIRVVLGVDGVIHIYKLIDAQRHIHLVAIGKEQNLFTKSALK